ncbi:MAG: DUF3108 domain-containing protein [Candidatus Omnitrophica bacterium]|jgi:hypothetical protein|nr:DUF3108 domain-containing protein [Candidatus Omnitrophota bacterium]
MPRTTAILAIIYFFLVEAVIIMYSRPGAVSISPKQAAGKTAPVFVEEKKAPDYSGEKIVYDVKMGGIKIGTSTFMHREKTILDGKQAHLVEFTTKVVKINDTETIWADTKDFLPMRIQRDVRMWPKYERITEDYDQVLYTIDITKTAGGSTEKKRIKKQGPIHNAILLPFQLRLLEDLRPGWSMKITLPQQDYQMTLKSLEDIEVPAGKFRSFYLESDPKRFSIWISADDKRIPLKIVGANGLNYTLSMRSYSK